MIPDCFCVVLFCGVPNDNKCAPVRRAATNTSNLGNNLSSKSATITSHNTQTKQALRQGLARFTHNYHLHPHRTAHNVATLTNVDTSASGHYQNQYGEQDVSHWKRLLLGILEEERTAMVCKFLCLFVTTTDI